jgi:hypothetical protein
VEQLVARLAHNQEAVGSSPTPATKHLITDNMKAKPIALITLKAKKVKEDTGTYKGFPKTLLYQDGSLKATIPASATQPRKGQKTIILNGWKFALKW